MTSGALKLIADGATGIRIRNVSNLLDCLSKAEERQFRAKKKSGQLELFNFN
jgi:hypothetical protein